MPQQFVHRIAQPKIYRSCGDLKEPKQTVRIPVEIDIFGEKIKGILDSGSERSFLSCAAYQRVKHLQIQELEEDSSSKKGVRLGDKSIVKSLGGTGFVIDIGDIYGPQWFSVLPELSSDLILGMDFWLNFKVKVDPFAQVWTLDGSKFEYSLSRRLTGLNVLQTLSCEEDDTLRTFLDDEFKKLEEQSTGETDLVKHIIELEDSIPHRQKPYRPFKVVTDHQAL